jgi:hypothetical protein
MPEPVASEAHYGRGLAYAKLGNFENALDDFRVVTRLPESSPLHSAALARIAELGKTQSGSAAVSDQAPVNPAPAGPDALTLSGDLHWVALASRRDVNEAIAIAQQFGSGARVVRTKNGWFTAIIGPFKVIDIATFRTIYKGSGTIPSDALLANGSGYIDTVWQPETSVTIASEPPITPASVPPAADKETRRVALVIGNSAYANVAQLANPRNDAKLIGNALAQDGFKVTVADDLDRSAFVNSLKNFANQAAAADWAVVYFAGHGIEMDGTNYLIPVDAKLLTDRDIEFETVPLSLIMSSVDAAHDLRVVILDACRNNPFVTGMKRNVALRDVSRGLGRIDIKSRQGTVIVYSAKPGQLAHDGDGPNSPFAIALARHLTEPGVEISKLFRFVSDDVLAATGNDQEVFQDIALPGKDFFFRLPVR